MDSQVTSAAQLVLQLKSGQITKDQLLQRLQSSSQNSDLPLQQNYDALPPRPISSNTSGINLPVSQNFLNIQTNSEDKVPQSGKRIELHRKRESIQSEQQKCYQMPLQFSDKFFDEDPGLIRIENCQSQPNLIQNNFYNHFGQELNDLNNSNESFEVISSQLKLLSTEKENMDIQFDKKEIMRRASELTKAIDSQYTNPSGPTQRLYYPSLLTSPNPAQTASASNFHNTYTDLRGSQDENPVVRANHVIMDQFGQLNSYRSECTPDQDLVISSMGNTGNQFFKNIGSFDNSINAHNQKYLNKKHGLLTTDSFEEQEGETLRGGYSITNEAKNFSERNSKWMNQQNQRKHLIQMQCEENQMRECTFKPNTNSKSGKMVSKQRAQWGSQQRGTQLYNQKGKKQLETQMRYQRDEDEKLQKTCTFKPQICEVSNQVPSRYMQLTDELINNKIPLNYIYQGAHSIENTEESQLKNCTFHPQVQGVKKNMQTASLYTSINAFERLSKPLSQLIPTFNEENQDLQGVTGSIEQMLIQEDTDYGRPPSQVHVLGQNTNLTNQGLRTPAQNNFQHQQETLSEIHHQSQYTSKSQFQEALTSFNERQQKFLMDKEMKRQRLEQELAPSLKPNINELSKFLVDERSCDFYARNQMFLEKLQQHQSQLPNKDSQECTFQPTITKLARQQRSKGVEELSYGDLLKKQKIIDQVNYQVQQDQMKQNTFKPELIAQQKNQEFHQIRSKLGLDDDLNTYIEKQQMEYLKRKAESEEYEKLKREMELEGCTYQPQIKECPNYIKRIAEESKKIREERQLILDQLPAGKPLWRD